MQQKEEKGFIETKFEGIVSKCIERYAKKYNAPQSEIFIVFGLKKDGESIENDYMILQNYAFKERVSFLDLLGVKFDLKGYSLFVPKTIKSSLVKLTEELKASVGDVTVIIKKPKDSQVMGVFNKGAFVRKITVQDVVNGEELLENEG